MHDARPALIAVAALAVMACGRQEPAAPAAAAPPATAQTPAAQAQLPAGHPTGAAMAAAKGASPHAAVAPIDVCGTLPLATVEAALGSIRKSKPLFASGENGPSPFAGGCLFIAAQMKSARVEIGNAESLGSVQQADARAYVGEAASTGMRDAKPLPGVGDAALIQDNGSVVLILAGKGKRVVQVMGGDISRDQAIAIVRTALAADPQEAQEGSDPH
jgi:hypothetical protein